MEAADLRQALDLTPHRSLQPHRYTDSVRVLTVAFIGSSLKKVHVGIEKRVDIC
jgi:hypothetical protein